MKKYPYLISFVIISLFFGSRSVQAQSPGIVWQRTLGSFEKDVSQCVQQTPDGGYVVVGTSQEDEPTTLATKFFNVNVTRLSATGSVLWDRVYGGGGNEYGYTIRNTVDGGFIVSASTSSSDHDVSTNFGAYDVWVLKLSAAGDIEWEKSFGGSAGEAAFDIRQTLDTGYIFVGSTASANGHVTENKGGYDMWVVKLSKTGSLQWQHTYGGSANENLMSVLQTADGGYIVAGDTYSSDGDITGSHGYEDYWVAKLSATGNIEWKRCYGGGNADYAQSIRTTPDGGYIVAGGSNSTNGDVSSNIGGGDMWIVKLSAAGGILWQRSFGSTADDAANSIEVTADGGFLVSGWVSGGNTHVTGFKGARDYWLVKLSSTASIQWQKCLNNRGFNEANCAIQTTDGDYLVAGRTVAISDPNFSDGWVVALSHSVEVNEIPASAELSFFPNPTTGPLFLKGITNADITVTNLQSVVVKAVRNANQLDISEVPAGIYMVTVSAGQGPVTHFMVSKL